MVWDGTCARARREPQPLFLVGAFMVYRSGLADQNLENKIRRIIQVITDYYFLNIATCSERYISEYSRALSIAIIKPRVLRSEKSATSQLFVADAIET